MRDKQRLEISDLQRIRDKIKIKMILKLKRLTNKYLVDNQPKEVLFTNLKVATSDIMKKATSQLKTQYVNLNSDELTEVTLNDLNEKFQFQDSLLDQKNKSIMHLKRI